MDSSADEERLADAGSPAAAAARPTPMQRARVTISAAVAAVLGLAPHLLHHAGPVAGAALFAGVGGTLLFGALGLLAAIPFLIRLHRRQRSWRLPALVLVLFAAAFSLSAFVVGPALTGEDSDPDSEQPGPSSSPDEHEAHH